MLSVLLSLFQFTVPTAQSPAEFPLFRLACGRATSRGGPLLHRSLPLSARPRLLPGPLRVAASSCSGRAPPPRQSLRVSSCVRAAGAAAACRRWRLIPWTLEPVVGRPWWRLSDRPCLSATFTRAAIQPADREQSSRRRQHWRRCPGDAEAWGGLLLLKIASAGLCGNFGRRLLWSTSISPHSHQLGFRRGLGEGFHGGAPMARRAPTCVA